MLAFSCPACSCFLFFESQKCPRCHITVGLIQTEARFIRLRDGVGVSRGESNDDQWRVCANWDWECNWLIHDSADLPRCFSCLLTRNRPASDDTIAWEKLATTDAAKRRLVMQLLGLRLPVESFRDVEGGLAFDLLSSHSSNERVTIGHANGVITIDLVESLDAHREAMRVRLGEPYRTMLGHFRHEAGHYYQNILIEKPGGTLLDLCRQLFGDERSSYADAQQRHYKLGPPKNWNSTYISEYATMHPWEDFAECFAHYLHITDSLATAATAGMVLDAERVDEYIDESIVPRSDYADASMDDILHDWKWLSLVLNRVNRAMGQADLYPFTIPQPVREKLSFVHEVVRNARV